MADYGDKGSDVRCYRCIAVANQGGLSGMSRTPQLARREFLRLTAGIAALCSLSRRARSQSYPVRPVRIVVAFPPGSTPDIAARVVGQPLSEQFGRQFIVESRPGAGTNIGTEVVVRAAPDGYTLLIAVTTNAINSSLYPDLGFNFARDIAPVAMIGDTSFVMVVNPAFPAKTLAEFIIHAKANPGRVNMASPGNGTTAHFMGELFMMMAGVELVHVPYRSSYLPDLFGGQVQVVFSSIPQMIEPIRSGKLRALAVTSARRLNVFPEIPAIGEVVPGYEADGWIGVGAPRNTPAPIVDKLNQEISAAISDASTKARLIELGIVPRTMTPGEFAKFIAAETDKWAKVARFAGVKPE
jgi:tripartite-type tricarboxylate transporter receptor subunit TctC